MTAGAGREGASGPDGSAPAGAVAVSTLNLANLLTISRLVLVPLFVLALFTGSGHGVGADVGQAGVDATGADVWRYVATVLFAVAALTDRVDGWIARKYDLITDFGKIADPIADKALIGAALVGLSVLGELPWWVTIVIAVRELGITALRFWVIRRGVIPASRGGKAKTLAQVLGIGLFLLPLPAGFAVVSWTVLIVALVLTVATGLDYVVRAVRLRTGAGEAS